MPFLKSSSRLRWMLAWFFFVLLVSPLFSETRHTPTIDEMLNLQSVVNPRISPDGKFVVYGVRETDWKENAYVTQLWLANTATGANFQLTQGKKSAENAQWSLDGRWITFTVGDDKHIPEVFVSSTAPFEPRRLSDMNAQFKDWIVGSVEMISWKSHDGTTIEGVLHKPADFDPHKKYPLSVWIGSVTISGVNRFRRIPRCGEAAKWLARRSSKEVFGPSLLPQGGPGTVN